MLDWNTLRQNQIKGFIFTKTPLAQREKRLAMFDESRRRSQIKPRPQGRDAIYAKSWA